jgi:hypothetical protein
LDDDRDNSGYGTGGLPDEGNRYDSDGRSGPLVPSSRGMSVLFPSQDATVVEVDVDTHHGEGEREQEGVEFGAWDLAIVVGPGNMIGTIGVRKKLRSVLKR